jgi:hypothetical protein
MNEPRISESECLDWPFDYIDWARENKKRADRLLVAVNDILKRAPGDYNNPLWIEMRNAAVDYEDRIG